MRGAGRADGTVTVDASRLDGVSMGVLARRADPLSAAKPVRDPSKDLRRHDGRRSKRHTRGKNSSQFVVWSLQFAVGRRAIRPASLQARRRSPASQLRTENRKPQTGLPGKTSSQFVVWSSQFAVGRRAVRPRRTRRRSPPPNCKPKTENYKPQTRRPGKTSSQFVVWSLQFAVGRRAIRPRKLQARRRSPSPTANRKPQTANRKLSAPGTSEPALRFARAHE
jgi:hypothetical protein